MTAFVDDREPTIVFLDRETLPPETNLRSPSFEHRMVTYDRTAPEEVAGRIAAADIVITNKVPVQADAIAGAPRLRLIAVSATGTDMVDLGACSKRDIVVSNVRGYAVTTLPEHVFAMVFALRRSLLAYRDAVAAGRWQTASQFCFLDYPIRDLAGATIGIVGVGTLGSAVAKTAEALGMRVLLSDRKGATEIAAGRTAFDDVLAESDVITLHAPLNDETRGLIGEAEFGRMTRRPILINTGRGGLVDEEALDGALASGAISGAGFDVATVEPPPADHPLMKLVKYPNFILTPHVAWASENAIQQLADQLVDNIEAYAAGDPRNVVSGTAPAP